MSEWAYDRLKKLEALLKKLEGELRAALCALEYGAEELASQRTQAAFWKRACEQALDGWNSTEDELDALKSGQKLAEDPRAG